MEDILAGLHCARRPTSLSHLSIMGVEYEEINQNNHCEATGEYGPNYSNFGQAEQKSPSGVFELLYLRFIGSAFAYHILDKIGFSIGYCVRWKSKQELVIYHTN